MANAVSQPKGNRSGGRRVAALCASLGLAVAITGTALAQDAAKPAAPAVPTKPAAPAAKPAAPAATATAPPAASGALPGGPPTQGPPVASVTTDAQKKSAWVKLCEKAPFDHKDKDGKDIKEEKQICLTHHERLDGNTGMVVVSAAIREVEGSDKKALMIMVPLGMAIPPGIRAAVYSKDQWASAAKNEKIDEKTLKPIELKFSLCHPAGCTAETLATPEMVEEMKAGGGLMVIAMNAAAQPIGFPVPLDGFGDAYAGKPVDNKEYAKARGQLMAQIRERQQQAMEKFKADQMKDLPPPPGGAAAPAAKDAPKK